MLYRLIYTSTSHCDPSAARVLCLKAQQPNLDRQVTGALYLENGAFIQYLEVDEFTLSTLFHRIRGDARHSDCRLLDSRLVTFRLFKTWSMEWLADAMDTYPEMQRIVTQRTGPAVLEAPSVTAMFIALSGVQLSH